MQQISPDSFAMVCFLVLMENGDGIMDKSPIYVGEKMYLLHHGIEAFGALDIYNKRKVKAWCENWGIDLPKECADNLDAEEEAWKELKAQGFEL